jgi:integrase
VAGLTKSVVDDLIDQHSARDLYAWDSGIAGFGVRVKPSGIATYIVQFRNSRGRTRRISLGKHGVLTVDAARKLAIKALADVAHGEDPAEKRKALRKAPKVRELTQHWLDTYAPRLSPRYVANCRLLIAKRIIPAIGETPVADVTREACRRLHDDCAATPYQANRLLSLLHRLFRVAVLDELRSTNPAAGIERFREDPKNNYIPRARLPQLIDALMRHPNQQSARAIYLLLLTGARLNELLRAKVEMFEDDNVWTKPSAHTKQRREHRLPLSEAAAAVVREQLAAARGSVWLFPSPRSPDRPLQNVKAVWNDVLRSSGLPHHRLHDLRHTHASLLAGVNSNLLLIGAALGHTQAATTLRYAGLEQDPLRAAAEKVAVSLGVTPEDEGGVTSPLRGGDSGRGKRAKRQ